MKYVVLVDGRSIEVEIVGDRVSLAGRTHRATLGAITGTPLRQLLLDDEPSTMSIASLGRGRWALTEHG